jgi:hypothetical protein
VLEDVSHSPLVQRTTWNLSRAAAFRYLCNCLASPGRGIAVSRRTAGSRNFTWASFIATAFEYAVAPAIPSALKQHELGELLPPNVTACLNDVAGTLRDRNKKIVDQAVTVAKILNRIEVTPVFLKGGANLLRGLYADLGSRQMVDLDVLVPVERLAESADCLRESGFQPLTDYLHPRSHHYPPLGRATSPSPVELHHHVLSYGYDRFLTAKEVIGTAHLLYGYEARIAVPSPACAVIHNIAHAQLSNHDYLYGRVDLRSLFDFGLLSRTYMSSIDWSEIGQRFSRYGGGRAFGFHLLCARDLLGIEIPEFHHFDAVTKFLFWRAEYLAAKPKLLDLNVRVMRPWLLLRRELSDPALRRRLARNIADLSWWTRHLRMLCGRP